MSTSVTGICCECFLTLALPKNRRPLFRALVEAELVDVKLRGRSGSLKLLTLYCSSEVSSSESIGRMNYTIVGVIGHIDHGKTSLVAALSGVDTDTHPEEKRRGITIDLGFASYIDQDDQFALIDAPGHQKYIGNLLAGVSAVDIGLLVVAADQGIQAQTLEHAAILQSLGVKTLVVAMSRVDLVDQTTRDQLAEELDFFLAEFGFHDIPQIQLSIVTGEGLESLKEKLRELARTNQRSQQGRFEFRLTGSLRSRDAVASLLARRGVVRSS